MADYEYVESTGTIIPDTAALLATVEAEFKKAFGQDLDVSPSSPQGVLIAAEVASRDAVVRNNAAVANQINPNIAGGIFFDAIYALTGGQREESTRTVVAAQLTGKPNTVIQALSQAQTTGSILCELVSAVTLDADGDGEGVFQAILFGPLTIPIGTLTQIVSDVLGWETVTNATAGVPGTLVQSDASGRTDRRNTLALQGQSISEAITSGLYDTPGVGSLQFRENFENTTQTIDGIELVAHSIWVCIDGGTDDDIAETLTRKKSGGCNYNGDVEAPFVDPFSGQTVVTKFDRPIAVEVQARVTIRVLSAVTNPEETTQDAILTYAAGELDGEPGFVVGASVSPFELAAAVNIAAIGVYVKLMEVKKVDAVDWETTEIVLELNEIARINRSLIQVLIV